MERAHGQPLPVGLQLTLLDPEVDMQAPAPSTVPNPPVPPSREPPVQNQRTSRYPQGPTTGLLP